MFSHRLSIVYSFTGNYFSTLIDLLKQEKRRQRRLRLVSLQKHCKNSSISKIVNSHFLKVMIDVEQFVPQTAKKKYFRSNMTFSTIFAEMVLIFLSIVCIGQKPSIALNESFRSSTFHLKWALQMETFTKKLEPIGASTALKYHYIIKLNSKN